MSTTPAYRDPSQNLPPSMRPSPPPARPPSPPLPQPVGSSAFPAAAVTAGEQFKHSETTRLLCASAYLDREFRDLVLKFCLEKKHQALGACFGLDMPTVVRHCRKANKMLGSRELWLLAPSLIAIFTIFVIVASEGSGGPGILFVGAVLALLLAFGIVLYFEQRAKAIVTQYFMRGNFKPDATLQGDDTPITNLQAAERGNTVIYSGFTPFVGSGENMGAWSFALDLRKRTSNPDQDKPENLTEEEIEKISLESLYECIDQEIEALKLDRVTVQDKLYVNGRDIRDDTRFLPNATAHPYYRVDEQVIRSAMLEQNEKHLRHYRCIRVVDWNGELVFSMFLRFSKLSHNLFVESSYYLLAPIAERFRAVDKMSPRFNRGRFIGLLILTAFKTPFLTALAPFVLLGRLTETMKSRGEEKEQEALILDDPSFDYGAAFSFRQWASSSEYRRYFQKLDKEMYLKVLEKNILDSMLTFLESHDVDVSELKQRQSVILNQGVMLSGNSQLSAGDVAVGKNAAVEKAGGKLAQFAAKVPAAAKPAA